MAKKKTEPESESKTVILNESDSALDAFCMSRGTSIVFLDEKLAALPDDNVNKPELTRLRARVEGAHRDNNLELLDGWFHALIIGLKAACHTIPLAIHGEVFRNGRKVNTGSLMREAIARETKKNKNLMPRHLWAILKRKPPKGWTFFDNSLGEYFEWPMGRKEMKYSRFSEICKEEKGKLSA